MNKYKKQDLQMIKDWNNICINLNKLGIKNDWQLDESRANYEGALEEVIYEMDNVIRAESKDKFPKSLSEPISIRKYHEIIFIPMMDRQNGFDKVM